MLFSLLLHLISHLPLSILIKKSHKKAAHFSTVVLTFFPLLSLSPGVSSMTKKDEASLHTPQKNLSYILSPLQVRSDARP